MKKIPNIFLQIILSIAFIFVLVIVIPIVLCYIVIEQVILLILALPAFIKDVYRSWLGDKI